VKMDHIRESHSQSTRPALRQDRCREIRIIGAAHNSITGLGRFMSSISVCSLPR
jgi:hypothetical protein